MSRTDNHLCLHGADILQVYFEEPNYRCTKHSAPCWSSVNDLVPTKATGTLAGPDYQGGRLQGAGHGSLIFSPATTMADLPEPAWA